MMIGGETEVIKRLDQFSRRSPPGMGDIPSTIAPQRRIDGTAEQVTCTAVQMALATSSRWSTTEMEYGIMAA